MKLRAQGKPAIPIPPTGDRHPSGEHDRQQLSCLRYSRGRVNRFSISASETVTVPFRSACPGQERGSVFRRHSSGEMLRTEPGRSLIAKSSSGRVRLIRRPAQKAASRHGGGNHSHGTSGCGFEPAHFSRTERGHALGGIMNLLPAVKADLIGLLFQRERPRQTRVAAAKHNIVEKTKQALYPVHKRSLFLKRQVARAKCIVKMHSA